MNTFLSRLLPSALSPACAVLIGLSFGGASGVAQSPLVPLALLPGEPPLLLSKMGPHPRLAVSELIQGGVSLRPAGELFHLDIRDGYAIDAAVDRVGTGQIVVSYCLKSEVESQSEGQAYVLLFGGSEWVVQGSRQVTAVSWSRPSSEAGGVAQSAEVTSRGVRGLRVLGRGGDGSSLRMIALSDHYYAIDGSSMLQPGVRRGHAVLGFELDVARTAPGAGGQEAAPTAELIGYASRVFVLSGRGEDTLALLQAVEHAGRMEDRERLVFVSRNAFGGWRVLGQLELASGSLVREVVSGPSGTAEVLVLNSLASEANRDERIGVMPEGGRVVDRSCVELDPDYWKRSRVFCVPGPDGHLSLLGVSKDGSIHRTVW